MKYYSIWDVIADLRDLALTIAAMGCIMCLVVGLFGGN
jgi:hypothetical protein